MGNIVANTPKKTDIFLNLHIQPGSKIIVGLSGGPDSIFLLHYLAPYHQAGTLSLIAAHLDHEWRQNSAQDAEFCQKICVTLGIPFENARATDLGHFKANGSKEELGRQMRRRFFETILKKHTADYIALGHHAQDQQETFFMRLFRGTSLTGLRSIKVIDGFYIRPLLHLHKQDILAYLNAHNIPYLTDETNTSQAFLRNRIRAHIIPMLAQTDSRWNQKFSSTLSKLQNTEAFLENLTHKHFIEITAKNANGTNCLDVQALKDMHIFLQERLIVHWLYTEKVNITITDSFIKEIMRFLCSPRGGTHKINTQWSVKKIQNKAWIVTSNVHD